MSHAFTVLAEEAGAERGDASTICVVATAVRKLDLTIGELVEVGGRRYEVVADREGGLTLEPPITPMAELDEKRGTAPASAEDFSRLTAEYQTDGEE